MGAEDKHGFKRVTKMVSGALARQEISHENVFKAIGPFCYGSLSRSEEKTDPQRPQCNWNVVMSLLVF